MLNQERLEIEHSHKMQLEFIEQQHKLSTSQLAQEMKMLHNHVAEHHQLAAELYQQITTNIRDSRYNCIFHCVSINSNLRSALNKFEMEELQKMTEFERDHLVRMQEVERQIQERTLDVECNQQVIILR